MSLRYKGAVISATPPTTTSGNSGTAPGAWTLQQQMQAQSAGNWPAPPIWYVEDVFSTWLYSGTGATNTQTIANGIDESGKGALTWFKKRSTTSSHLLFDTNRGNNSPLATDSTSGQGSGWSSYFNFLSNGVSVSDDLNVSGTTYASWTFRKQPKFFDIQTYTTNSGTGAFATISHNLGSVPGFILVKATNQVDDWYVYHRSNGSGKYMVLNSTAAVQTDAGFFSSVTSTQVVGLPNYASGTSYVVYLFAHDAGGFGPTNSDNVISCGSYTTVGGEASINLGYEPQWVMVKRSDGVGNWFIINNMMALANDGLYGELNYSLSPNTSSAQANFASPYATATGFENNGWLASAGTFIYVAIRRGPMRVPTDGTSVFATQATADSVTANSKTTYRFTSNFPIDLSIMGYRAGGVNNSIVTDRLRGFSQTTTGNAAQLTTSNSNAELSGSPAQFDNMFGQTSSATLIASSNFNAWMFRRAPGFFDEVCYTGTGVNRNIVHNLTVAPELIIVKRRDSAEIWPVWASAMAYGSNNYLNSTGAVASGNTDVLNYWDTVAVPPTSTTFAVGTHARVNASGGTYVAYLFASCPGVSKVGSYSGTASAQTISCGFAARFVLIKRTDSTGNWFVWDTARGMVAGTDPRLGLNLTTAEVNNNFVFTDASGFQLVTTDANVNASGGSYIYLAIA